MVPSKHGTVLAVVLVEQTPVDGCSDFNAKFPTFLGAMIWVIPLLLLVYEMEAHRASPVENNFYFGCSF